MFLKIKLIAKPVLEKVLTIWFGAKESLQKVGGRLLISPIQPVLLFQPLLSHVLLIHQGEPIDLLVSIKSSIKLRSKEGHSVTFQRKGAFLVTLSEGLEMVSE